MEVQDMNLQVYLLEVVLSFSFVLNDPKNPKVTLIQKTNGSWTKTNTLKNGIKSEKLINCKCILK